MKELTAKTLLIEEQSKDILRSILIKLPFHVILQYAQVSKLWHRVVEHIVQAYIPELKLTLKELSQSRAFYYGIDSIHDMNNPAHPNNWNGIPGSIVGKKLYFSRDDLFAAEAECKGYYKLQFTYRRLLEIKLAGGKIEKNPGYVYVHEIPSGFEDNVEWMRKHPRLAIGPAHIIEFFDKGKKLHILRSADEHSSLKTSSVVKKSGPCAML